MEDKILSNLKFLVFPFIRQLKKSREPSYQRSLIKIIESNIGQALSSFSHSLSSKRVGLTPTEVQVAGLVKQGYSSKEIAKILSSSVKTIDVHRVHIRKKIGLTGKKVNLQSYLSASFDSPDTDSRGSTGTGSQTAE